MVKSLLFLIACILGGALLLIALFVAYISLVDFRPDQEEVIDIYPGAALVQQDTLTLMTWNIGYAGLGKEMDFFYDGGKKVRPEKDMNSKYLDGISNFLYGQTTDFVLLQEVDVNSRRSYQTDQVQHLTGLMPGYYATFATNYKVPYVPVPLQNPMGGVHGGMVSLSRFRPAESVRFSYPLIASWPDRLFLLDRCFIRQSFPLANGRQLFVFNTHNSAYVYDSALRLKELEIIKENMLEAYKGGNYVIAGGDWNANPPGFKPDAEFAGHLFEASKVKMPADLLPAEWQWIFDTSVPTNRNNDSAYVKGKNGTTCLDYYIVSPNIEVVDIKTIDLEFSDSDHQPVILSVRLRE